MADDARYAPLYSIPECARYLGLPTPTVRSWVAPAGKKGDSSSSGDTPAPLVPPAGADPIALSFINLVELHVLAALRQRHKLALQRIRPAIDYIQNELGVHHPLARRELLTDGLNLFTEHLGALLNLSDRGQIAIREIVASYLKRVEHDDAGLAQRFYPFSRGDGRDAPMLVVIDPLVSYGRPVVAGSGVRTAVITGRLKSGEGMADIADDYLLAPQQVEEAVRYELAA